MLVKGGENRDNAYDLLDAMIAPDAGKWLIEAQGYGHSNKKSFELVSEDDLKKRGLPKDPATMLASALFGREQQRLADLQTMFEAVKASI